MLLDHCVLRPLHRHLLGFFIRTCHEEGWATLRNGELLVAAEVAGLEAFITADQNLRYQQNLTARQPQLDPTPRSLRRSTQSV
ncbi:MAG TPA: hypothetical protein DCE44_18155 [Verrucomicrobiales bacterium]|nr:hypothetical protein [Verrucomicrobiales bacterium]